MMENYSKLGLSGSRKRSITMIFSSLFLAWHSVALVYVGPGPDSHLMNQIRPLFAAYIKLFHLDSHWGFHAPDPNHGSILRYEIVTQDNKQEYNLTEKLHKSDPIYFRYSAFYLNYLYDEENYLNGFAQYLCAKHKAVAPQSLRFVTYYQKAITPTEYIKGARPLDQDRLTRETMDLINCKSEYTLHAAQQRNLG